MKAALTWALLCAAVPLAQAAEQPYAGEQHRQIKSLSAEDVHGYMQGAGMGQAKAAELNGYPGPMHALELADALALDEAQQSSLQRLMHEHKAEARALGAEVVRHERELAQLFATRKATPATIDESLAALAAAQAKLRGSHLKTHLATAKLLRDDQIRRYAELRGYADAPSRSGHAHH